MQLNPLTVQDPLTDKTVIINIQVSADSKSRDERSVLVTAGIIGKAPIMLSGRYGQISSLIEQAWKKFGQSESKSKNETKSATIAQLEIKPTKKPKTPNKESILSLF